MWYWMAPYITKNSFLSYEYDLPLLDKQQYITWVWNINDNYYDYTYYDYVSIIQTALLLLIISFIYNT